MTISPGFKLRSKILHRVADAYGLAEWPRSYLDCDISLALSFQTPIQQAIKQVRETAELLQRNDHE